MDVTILFFLAFTNSGFYTVSGAAAAASLDDVQEQRHLPLGALPSGSGGHISKDGKSFPTVKKPRALKVKSLTPTIVKVKWRRPKQEKSSIKGYRLSWRRKRGHASSHTVNVTSRSYIISGLETNTWYVTSVMTIDKHQRFSNQTSVSFKTSMPPVTMPPRNLTAKAIGTTKIKVFWAPPKRNKGKVTEYKIQYKRKGVRRGDLCTVTASSWKREYVLTDLLKGEHYKIRIAAKTGKISGPNSDWVNVQLGGKRKNNARTDHKKTTTANKLSAKERISSLLNLRVNLIYNGVNITWNNVGMDIVSYTMLVTEDDTIRYIAEIPYDQNMFQVVTIPDLEPGREHNVTISAMSALGEEKGRGSLPFITPVPITVNTIRDPWVALGEDTSLMCVVKSYPKSKVRWTRENDSVIMTSSEKYHFEFLYEEGSKANTFLLKIRNVTNDDLTKYTCIAENELESATVSTDLRFIDSAFGTVSNLTTTSLLPREATLQWSSSLNFSPLRNISYKILIIGLDKNGENWTSVSYTNDVNHTLHNLLPSTAYHVQVGPDGPGDWHDILSDSFSFVTPRELPTPIISVQALNSKTVLVSWNNISEVSLRFYRVTFGIHERENSFDQRRVKPPATKIYLRDLKRNTHYEVRVQAVYTDVVTSSDWTNVSTTPDAYLLENVRPPPPADAFLSVRNTSLVIKWLPPHREYRTLVRFYQLDIYKGSDVIMRQILNEDIRNFTMQNFDKDEEHTVYLTAVNNKGASDSLLRMYQPTQAEDRSWNSVTDLQAHALSSTSILLEWSPPINGLLTRYLVRYRPTNYDETRLKDEWLGPSYNNYVIMGLQRFREYNISVIPYLNEKNGNESFVIVKTLSSPPAASPQNITISFINSSAISIDWEPPPSFTRNGLLTEYKIVYREGGSLTDHGVYVIANTTTALITDILPGKTYYFRIAAANVNGTGPYSDWVIAKTLELPKVTAVPGRPRNLTWSTIPYGVTIKWRPPADTNVPVRGYIVGHGRFLPEVYREIVDVDTLQYSIVKLRKHNDYVVSVRAFNEVGESPALITIATAGDNKVRPVDEDVSLGNETDDSDSGYDDEPRRIYAELNNQEVPTVQVTWDPPKEAIGPIQGYWVHYKAKGEHRWQAKLERSQSVEIKNLSFDTTYYIRVQPQYYNGAQGKMSKLVKIRTRSLDDIINVLPTPTITSVFSGTDHLLVSWKPPPSDFLHVVVGYVLGYGISEANEHQEFIPVSERSFRIGNLETDTQYLISLKMFNEFGESAKTVVKANTSAEETGR